MWQFLKNNREKVIWYALIFIGILIIIKIDNIVLMLENIINIAQPITIGLVIAYLFTPLCNNIEKLLHRHSKFKTRTIEILALTVTIIIMFIIIILFALLLIPQFV